MRWIDFSWSHLSALLVGALLSSGFVVQSARSDPQQILTVQVLLARAHFSPGEIDGVDGANTRRAIDAAREARQLAKALEPAQLIEALGGGATPTLVPYTISAEDMAGPFVDSLPDDMMARAKLPGLHYTSVEEALGERFHADPKLLVRLNPGTPFTMGATIQVPNLEGVAPPAAQGAVRITVSKSRSTLLVHDETDRLVYFAPVTSGSEHDPLPIGTWKVNGIARNPPFRYNPDLFWDADPSHAKATIPPGPNNPVGVVWIDITKEHYGLHGTPEPGQVGHATSHGCVRLTNWDALIVASLVRPGTVVSFVE